MEIAFPDASQSLTEVIFEQVEFLDLAIDVVGKRMCSDDIWGAAAYRESEWMQTLRQREALPHGTRGVSGESLHFQIDLVPPGGTINILARSFRLTEAASESGRDPSHRND